MHNSGHEKEEFGFKISGLSKGRSSFRNLAVPALSCPELERFGISGRASTSETRLHDICSQGNIAGNLGESRKAWVIFALFSYLYFFNLYMHPDHLLLPNGGSRSHWTHTTTKMEALFLGTPATKSSWKLTGKALTGCPINEYLGKLLILNLTTCS